MKKTTGILSAAAALTLAGSVGASAAILDFTDSGTALTGSIMGTTYTVTGHPIAPNTNSSGPGPITTSGGATLAGDNDGLGISNDEITYPNQWVTITFADAVTLVGAYVLDLYARISPPDSETANISVGSMPGASDAQLVATQTKGANLWGYGELTGLQLKGSVFTFFAGPGEDDNTGDYALAAIEVAPIPLPAGILLFGGALGALGALRRRKTA